MGTKSSQKACPLAGVDESSSEDEGIGPLQTAMAMQNGNVNVSQLINLEILKELRRSKKKKADESSDEKGDLTGSKASSRL